MTLELYYGRRDYLKHGEGLATLVVFFPPSSLHGFRASRNEGIRAARHSRRGHDSDPNMT